jgi:hypothetical protein
VSEPEFTLSREESSKNEGPDDWGHGVLEGGLVGKAKTGGTQFLRFGRRYIRKGESFGAKEKAARLPLSGPP